MPCEHLISEFTANYMEQLFYFCLKKTGNDTEAEDLAQDIVLNILIALNKGNTCKLFRMGRQIARQLFLSVNAVWQRLHRARIILKEGMHMAREFGTLSYRPEDISFICNRLSGSDGEP